MSCLIFSFRCVVVISYVCFFFNCIGPHWLKNLFFTYSVVLRAVIKATPYWKEAVFYTGDSTSDLKLKELVLDFINSTKYYFNIFVFFFEFFFVITI